MVKKVQFNWDEQTFVISRARYIIILYAYLYVCGYIYSYMCQNNEKQRERALSQQIDALD